MPGESLAHHASRNDFSRWLKARTEFAVAQRMRPRKVSDFATLEDLRADLLESIEEYRDGRSRATVADFDRRSFDTRSVFSRIGTGSLGGKARGLAFVSLLLQEFDVAHAFPEVRVAVPPTAVIATDAFDRFLDANLLRDFAMACDADAVVEERFEAAALPPDIRADLESYLRPGRLPARGQVVEPARGLAVPAVRGDLLHLHAAEHPPRSRRSGWRSW